MSFVWGIITGFMFGGCFGMILTALLTAAHRADERDEYVIGYNDGLKAGEEVRKNDLSEH